VMPVAVIFATCAICMVVGSLFTQAPSQETLDKFFKKKD